MSMGEIGILLAALGFLFVLWACMWAAGHADGHKF